MNFFNRLFNRRMCTGCNKIKFFVQPRRVFIEQVKQYASSHVDICRSCADAIQRAIKEMNSQEVEKLGEEIT